MLIIIVALSVLLVASIYFLFNQFKKVKTYTHKYGGVINVDDEIAKRQQQLDKIIKESERVTAKQEEDINNLRNDYATKRQLYDSLVHEVNLLEENLENISYGLYKPHYDYNTSAEYKRELERIQEQQKALIKDEKATFCPIAWQVGNSRKDGEKMVKQTSKMMLRAFNGECDAAISKVRWNNVTTMEARINKAYEALNKLASTSQISITEPYLKLKLKELYLEYELEEKIHQEKEEQQRIKDQMREEEIALKEIERAQKEAEDEEKRYNKALEKAREEISVATGERLAQLTIKIGELEASLRQAQEQKLRAISRAQLTKSGHVYIISNIGSFGDDVFKIGMTRRLEPMDRVRELGDASVPFQFDVHGIIYSDNAPELENQLHKKFDKNRLNLVNQRREFFRLSLADIEEEIKSLNVKVELTKLAEAKEFRESISIRDARSNATPVEKNEPTTTFPLSI